MKISREFDEANREDRIRRENIKRLEDMNKQDVVFFVRRFSEESLAILITWYGEMPQKDDMIDIKEHDVHGTVTRREFAWKNGEMEVTIIVKEN